MPDGLRILTIVLASILVCPTIGYTEHLSPKKVGPRDVITKDGLIARDPYWGREEVKKIDQNLHLPDGIQKSDLGTSPVSAYFTISDTGKITNIKYECYDSRFNMPKAVYIQIQTALAKAIKQSKIRGPQLPGSPFNAVYSITSNQSSLSIIITSPPYRCRSQ